MVLVGYWPLNETEGNTAYDYSGNENHGSLEGSPTQGVNGVVGGNAYEFDGESDYVSADFNQELWAGLDQLTFACWFKTETSDTAVLGGSSQTSTQIIQFRVNRNVDGNLRAYVEDEDSNDFGAETVIGGFNDGDWHHVVFVMRFEEGNLSIYVDGVLRDLDYGFTGSDIDLGPMDFPLSIGAQYNYDDVRNYFPGDLSEVRFYNRALSASEVQYLYNVSKRGRFCSDKK